MHVMTEKYARPQRKVFLLLVWFFILQCSCVLRGSLNSNLTDQSLDNLRPREVVQLYWTSAVAGDVTTIKRLVGPPHDSMLWDCPPNTSPGDASLKGVYGTSDQDGGSQFEGDATLKSRDDAEYNLKTILERAKIIRIARRTFISDFEFGEDKISDREALLLVRPKESPDRYNSLVFFMLKEDQRWRIVDVTVEDHLRFVGNKKFGQDRICDKSQSHTR